MSDADEEDASMAPAIDASMIDTSLIAASPQDAGPSEAEQHDRLSQLEKEMAILQARIRSLKPIIFAPKVDDDPASQSSDIQTQKTTNTGVSSMGRSSTGSEVYTVPGTHGEFKHRHKHGRKKIVGADEEAEMTRQIGIFAAKATNGNVAKVREIQERYAQLNSSTETHDAATAMLTPFILLNNCKHEVLRLVFGISEGRFKTARDGPKESDENSRSSGRNGSAFGATELEQLRQFIESKFNPFFVIFFSLQLSMSL